MVFCYFFRFKNDKPCLNCNSNVPLRPSDKKNERDTCILEKLLFWLSYLTMTHYYS